MYEEAREFANAITTLIMQRINSMGPEARYCFLSQLSDQTASMIQGEMMCMDHDAEESIQLGQEVFTAF